MASFKIVLYKQKTLKDGTHPVLLQFVHNRRPYRISLKYSCAPEHWDFAAERFKRSFPGHQAKNKVLRDALTKAEEIQDNLRQKNLPFTPDLFRRQFIGNQGSADLFAFLRDLIKELDKKGKIGNKQVYHNTLNALKRFWGSRPLMFPDVNYTFLKRLETSLLQEGCSAGGASVYMRTLRAAINEAIKRGLMDKDLYPFQSSRNSNGYSIAHLKSAVSPKALSADERERFKHFPKELHPHLTNSHQLFLFSYYARGMNFTDMAHLKWSNASRGRIHYTREKTGTSFNIPISENLQRVLDHFEALAKDEINVFPILNESHQTPQQRKRRIKKVAKKVNRDLKEIASILDISSDITFYWARHTYASTLLENHVDVARISQGLGHKDLTTTKSYLKRFEDREIDQLDDLL